MNHRSRIKISCIAATGLLLIGAGPLVAEELSQAMPIPKPKAGYGWFKNQRVNYSNRPLWKKANALVAEGKHTRAARVYDSILATDPHNNKAKVHLIHLYFQLEEWTRGIDLAESLIANYPDYLDAYFFKANYALRAGRTQLAVRTFEDILNRDPSRAVANSEAYKGLARARFPARAYQKRLPEVHRSLARLYSLSGDAMRAEEHAARWRDLTDEGEAHLFVAESALSRKDWDKAMEALTLAGERVDTEELKGRLSLKRGMVLYNLKDYDRAMNELMNAESRTENAADKALAQRYLGQIALKKGANTRAADYLLSATAIAFDEDAGAAALQALMASEQWERGVTAAEKMLKRENLSDNFQRVANENLMYFYKNSGNDRGYAMVADKLRRESPDDPRYLLESAVGADRLGRDERAREFYTTYLEGKFDPAVAFNLFYLLKETEDLAAGEVVLDRVVATEGLTDDMRLAANYELAQVYRATNRTNDYMRIMDQVVLEKAEAELLFEYGVQLYGSGYDDLAVELFKKAFERQTEAADNFKTAIIIAKINIGHGENEVGREWLEKARAFGEVDDEWHITMARTYFNNAEYDAVIERLLGVVSEQDTGGNLLLGFTYHLMRMPGLSLYHLNRVGSPEKLDPSERNTLFSNRAYLWFDQGNYVNALADAERAVAPHTADQMMLVQMKALLPLNRYEEARDIGLELLDTMDEEEAPSFVADLMKTLGTVHFYLNDNENAVEFFTAALKVDDGQYDVYYLRALAYHRLEEYEKAEEDFLLIETESSFIPAVLWGDMGIVEGYLENYDTGTVVLARSLEYYRYDIDGIEEMAYQHMKNNDNAKAQDAFFRGVRAYDNVIPYITGPDREIYTDDRKALKREYAKLDRTWTFETYVNRTEFGDDAVAGFAGTLSAVDGGLPSQAGVYLGYRPPKLGFRDEKTLDGFARVLANFEPDSWALDEDTYQLGIGLDWKPFKAFNYSMSFEKLIAIGDNAEDNWLWRNKGSVEFGEKPKKLKEAWTSGRLYGDIAWYLDDPNRVVYYLDGRLARTIALSDTFLLTIPQGKAVWRYQNNDPDGIGSYVIASIGFEARFLEKERDALTERWYMDLFAHYAWGWFTDEPRIKGDRNFEGIWFGATFRK